VISGEVLRDERQGDKETRREKEKKRKRERES
jgi:hypothetical protein